MAGIPLSELQDASDPQNLSDHNDMSKAILIKLQELESRIAVLEGV